MRSRAREPRSPVSITRDPGETLKACPGGDLKPDQIEKGNMMLLQDAEEIMDVAIGIIDHLAPDIILSPGRRRRLRNTPPMPTSDVGERLGTGGMIVGVDDRAEAFGQAVFAVEARVLQGSVAGRVWEIAVFDISVRPRARWPNEPS